ncbi:S41 family peptidase [Thermincola potens]|uniref:Carboxyl-terminal protease n=1 Tax=Thermincola potens (strain JR) TaxID=635013 RepID=D5XCC0_THEPJ|nr:S41 family peptidase [Thermincola potens]ADG83572.1 carboxyl-terminal protease [Thermincola potens JR]
MREGKRVLLGVLAVFIILSVVASGLVTGALITNYNNVGTLARVISLIERNYLETVKTETLVEGAVKGIVDSLGDPYSVYMPPKMFKELQEKMQGSFGGVGIIVSMKGEHIAVIEPIKGTPAEKAGIKAGDIITKVNDKDTKDMDLDTAVGLMRGPVGTEVVLQVFRKQTNKFLNFKIVREMIEVPTVEGKILPNTKIGYIAISMFASNTDEELDKVLQEVLAHKPKGLILDLRDNPGGDLESAVRIADKFIPKGPIVYVEYRTGSDEYYEADDKRIELPLVVLINENSASASEIVAGAIKDTGSGTLVGTKTFGKGVVQSIYTLQNKAGLKLTTAKYLTPKKKDIHKKGIQPDVKVELPENSEKDLQLEKAISILEEKSVRD